MLKMEKLIKRLTKEEQKRKEMIEKQIKRGCNKCSQWDEYFGCCKCESL